MVVWLCLGLWASLKSMFRERKWGSGWCLGEVAVYWVGAVGDGVRDGVRRWLANRKAHSQEIRARRRNTPSRQPFNLVAR
jgi:hypothetical protein